MHHRPFGSTGAQVSEIGFGCASWWGKRAFDEVAAVRLVHQALEGGISLFDTGAGYSEGWAEARLGRALAGRDTSGLIVATKAGTDFVEGRIRRDFSPDAVEASLVRSLKRLGLDTLPLLQLHGPTREEAGDALLERLQRLRERGLVRWLGLNSFDPAVLGWAADQPLFDALMLDYNVLRPDRAPLIERAAANGKAVLAGMPLAMGHVAGQVWKLRRPRDLWYAARGLARHRREVGEGAKFGFLGRTPGWSAAQGALAYVLAHPAVSAAVVGTTRPRHLAELIETSGRALPEESFRRISNTQSRLARGSDV